MERWNRNEYDYRFWSANRIWYAPFYVEIPAAPRDAVSIYEDFGFDGDEAYRETVECRLVLARELWTKIRDDVRRDFNARLKVKSKAPAAGQLGELNWTDFWVESCASLAGQRSMLHPMSVL